MAEVAIGYLTSPGYPKYYLGGRECVWSLQAASGQAVSLLKLKGTSGVYCNDIIDLQAASGQTVSLQLKQIQAAYIE